MIVSRCTGGLLIFGVGKWAVLTSTGPLVPPLVTQFLALVGSTARRRRVPAEEARLLILDAAEQRLAEFGLDGLNIVDVARDANKPLVEHLVRQAKPKEAVARLGLGANKRF